MSQAGSYWISASSCSIGDGPGITYDGRLCAITVFLDRELQELYSCIHLLVYYDGSILENQDLVTRRQLDLQPWGMGRLDVREQLSRQLSRRRLFDAADRRQILRVELEAYVETGQPEEHIVAIRIRPLPVQLKHLLPDHSLEIIYEANQEIGPNSPFIHFLHLDRSFLPYYAAWPDDGFILPVKTRGIYILQLSVLALPSLRQRKCLPVLDHALLLNIIEHTLDFDVDGWHVQAIRLGGVSSKWRQAAMEAAAEAGNANSFQSVHGLMRLSSIWPETCSHLRRLAAENYHGRLFNDIEPHVGLASILTSARSLRFVKLTLCNQNEAKVILEPFQALEEIEELSITAIRGTLSIRLLQKSVSTYTKCRSFELSIGRPLGCSDFLTLESRPVNQIHDQDLHPNSESDPWCPGLQKLALYNADLYGEMLLKFIPYPNPALTDVTLDNIGGPGNGDFRIFLSKIAHSIQVLSVRNCDFPLRFYNDDFAIDTMMGNFTRLENLLLCNSQVSPLTIERKLKLLDGEGGIIPCAITIEHNQLWIDTWERGLPPTALVDAMKVTGWDVIGIKWDQQDNVAPGLREEVEQIAIQRAITLYPIGEH